MKQFLMSALLAGSALVAHAQEEPAALTDSVTHKLFQVQSQVLPNGLHVIRHHRDTSDTFTAQLVVEVGLQDFPCKTQQAPHLLEHMLFEGTQRYDRKALRQLIRDHGGLSNGFTKEEYTHYTFDIHSDYPDIALDALYSMMSEPLFNPADMETSRQVIHAEMGTSSNQLQLALSGKRVLTSIAKARIYSGSNLECPDLTTPEGISLEQIKTIFEQHYVPANMTLILLGHFDDARIDALLQQTFARLPARAPTPRAPVEFSAINYNPLQEKRALFDPEVDVHLFIPAVGSIDPAHNSYQIVAEYLGEQLFYDVRGQRGMAYTPQALVDNNSLYGYLQATTRTSDRWYDDVVRLFQEKYAQIRQQGVPQADVERLRQKLILEFESKQRDNAELAQVYRHYRHIIRARGSMPDLVALLQQVDAAQVKADIDRHFPEKPLLAILRPPTTEEILLRIGPPALLLGGIGVILLRWSHRRRMKASLAATNVPAKK